jgi:UDP-glucose 4-epimerase
MVEGMVLWNEPNNLSHWNFHLDPEWKLFADMVTRASIAIKQRYGRTYDLPVTALRFFNIYGTRQALSNPYTGVAAIFAARLIHGQVPLVFEDGEQMRDFVSVHDIVREHTRDGAA